MQCTSRSILVPQYLRILIPPEVYDVEESKKKRTKKKEVLLTISACCVREQSVIRKDVLVILRVLSDKWSATLR